MVQEHLAARRSKPR